MEKDKHISTLIKEEFNRKKLPNDFTDKVMQKIAAEQVKVEKPIIGKWMWVVIGLLCLAILGFAIIYLVQNYASIYFSWNADFPTEYFSGINLPFIGLISTAFFVLLDGILRYRKRMVR